MPLSTLNSPPLIGLLGAASFAILPKLETMALSWNTLKTLSFAAYWINLFAVMQPGRIDGAAQVAANEETKKQMKQRRRRKK